MTIQELEALIAYHQDLYYNGVPEISDAEFDLLWDELRDRAPESPVFSRVGADESPAFSKRAHLIPMNSQEKASSADEFLQWAEKIGHETLLVQYKLDGASIELQYEQGHLQHAVTRGDGNVGDDITANARRMAGVVAEVGDSFSGAVRGEVIMTHDIHSRYYSDKANCRNAANGLMRRKDGAGSEHLSVLVYDAFRTEGAFPDERAKLEWLSRNGFHTAECREFLNPGDVVEYRDSVAAIRGSLGYDIDGLVVKGNEIDLTDMRRARPQKQIAFKFARQEALTRLIEVEWSESGHLYTPVAIVEPVRIAGTTVRRASLVHPDLIAELGLKIGAEVVISKRGDIIPKVESVVHVPEGAASIVPPDVCSTCGSPVTNEGNRVYCPNPECPRRRYHRVHRWIVVLEVRDFGDALLRKLFDSGRVQNIADLYRLTVEEMVTFEGVGEKSARKILDNLAGASEIGLPRFVAGFDIDGVAQLTVEKLVEGGFGTIQRLFEATAEELAAVKGIGPVKAEVIREGLLSLRGEMEGLIDAGYVTLLASDTEDKPMAGISFCFTGSLERAKRSDAESLVRRLGGETKSSVTAGLSYLVTNSPESGSSKNRRARELEVPVIDEDAFWRLVDGLAPGSYDFDR